jgi:hypothetical protein
MFALRMALVVGLMIVIVSVIMALLIVLLHYAVRRVTNRLVYVLATVLAILEIHAIVMVGGPDPIARFLLAMASILLIQLLVPLMASVYLLTLASATDSWSGQV